MTDDPAPLESEELDELLSADLDGELAEAARERGSDVDAVRARIAVTPGAPERRGALAAARATLSEAPQLDELVAARLRAQAVRAAGSRAELRTAARRDRRHRALLTGGGIAACILLVVAIAFAVTRSGTSNSSNRSAAEPAAAPATPPSTGSKLALSQSVPALGSYTDERALGSVAVNTAQQRKTLANRDSAVPAQLAFGNSSGTSARKAGPARVTGGSPPASSAGSNAVNPHVGNGAAAGTRAGYGTKQSACSAAQFVAPGDRLTLHATATLNGRPVQVYVFTGPKEHKVVLLSPTCQLVNVQTVD